MRHTVAARVATVRTAITALVLAAITASMASAQTWTIDSKASLAWWQLSPHLGHLWATTCPQDPSWQPGESRGAGFVLDKATRKEVPIIQVEDPRVPLYPRGKVTEVCTQAVSGSIAIVDSTRWSGVRGRIGIRTEHFFNGMAMRDAYARKAVYKTSEYPEVRFHIDSLVNVRRGDTVQADAIGMFEFRGVRRAMSVPVRAWHENGGLRVVGKFSIPAPELVSVYGVSKFALGLSLGTHIWKVLHLGFDLILRPPAGAARG